MYAKIVVSAVLVLILPCESQHQRFFAVPFQDNDESISKPHQSQQLIRNGHFVAEKSDRNGNLHANLRRNNNFFANSIVANTEPQPNINQEHFNNDFEGIFEGQETHASTIGQVNYSINSIIKIHLFRKNNSCKAVFVNLCI